VGQQKNREKRRSLLSGLQGSETGREACPDSLNGVNGYREAQVGQQRNICKALIENNIRALILTMAGT